MESTKRNSIVENEIESFSSSSSNNNKESATQAIMNFKVKITPRKGEDEIHRFSLSRDAEAERPLALATLRDKLKEVSPRLHDKNYRLSWQDEDGDKIVVGTEDELRTGLREMEAAAATGATVLYKLTATILGRKMTREEEEEEARPGSAKGDLHDGIMCDGCERQVHGFRYKCVVCPDYDLCGECESRGGVHGEHNMIRIASPTSVWPKHFFRRLNKLHEKLVVGRQLGGGKEEEGMQEAIREAHDAAHQQALESLTQGSSWIGFSHKQAGRGGRGGKRVKGCCGHARKVEAAQLLAKEEDGEEELKEGEEEQSVEDVLQQLSLNGADYLRNLGTMISDALDNLVPDEDAEELKKKEAEEAGKTAETASDKKEEAEEDKKKEEAKEEKEKEKEDDKEKEEDVKKDEVKVEEEEDSGSSTIQDALDTLLNMGFTNDGGWLSQLLETKDGDVEKALDAIQPKAKEE